MSLAKKHFAKTMAAQQAATDRDNQPRANASQYELMLAQLHAHMQTLKGIESITTKCQRKAVFLKDYQPYIAGVLQADAGQQDDVLTTVMLWQLDAGMYKSALELGAYALKHKLTMPDQHQRSIGCILAEEIADTALKSQDGPGVPLLDLCTADNLLKDVDYPDPVKAKLYKALGYAFRADGKPTIALEYLKDALALSDRIGVKTDIKALEKELEAQSLQPVQSGSTDTPDSASSEKEMDSSTSETSTQSDEMNTEVNPS